MVTVVAGSKGRMTAWGTMNVSKPQAQCVVSTRKDIVQEVTYYVTFIAKYFA